MMREIACATQSEADAAAAAGDIIVWLAGTLILYGSSSAILNGSSSAILNGSSSAILNGSSRATDGKTGAPLASARPRVVIGPLGSRNETLGVSLPADRSDPIVYAGCWLGTLTDFAARVDNVYPSGRFGDEYRAAIAYIRAMHAIKEE